jgi:predicted ATP-grasp superfamily ATP-dependent carboligase
VAALQEHFRNHTYDAVIPVGLQMMELFANHRDSLAVPAMLPPEKSFRIAADKRLTFQQADAVGIPIPRTVPAREWRDLEPPLVFKHPKTGVLIAQTSAAAAQYAETLGPQIDDYVTQEYIPGENGFGYFGFFVNGKETRHFMHQRLMQFPKAGGPSVVARSIRNPRLRELGRTLLTSLGWHGAAMVEFKQSERDGEFYLMEINPKLWGSLDLAIQSRCNFPDWIVRSVMGDSLPSSDEYEEGVTYQWVIPNGLKCFLRYPEFRSTFLKNLVAPGVRTDLSWRDPLPNAAGLIAMASHQVRR